VDHFELLSAERGCQGEKAGQ